MSNLKRPEVIELIDAIYLLKQQLAHEWGKDVEDLWFDVNYMYGTIQKQDDKDNNRWHAFGKIKWECDKVIFSLYGEKEDRIFTLKDVKNNYI